VEHLFANTDTKMYCLLQMATLWTALPTSNKQSGGISFDISNKSFCWKNRCICGRPGWL